MFVFCIIEYFSDKYIYGYEINYICGVYVIGYIFFNVVNIYLGGCLGRWCFDVEFVYLCKWFGILMMEIFVMWFEISGLKVNLLSIFNMFWEFLFMFVGYRIGTWRISI